MKKLLSVLTLLICTFGFAQETEFKFTKDGFTDYVVTEVPGKTQAELYKKVLDWVQVTYKNPREVIKAQIENEYIRIEGAKLSMLCIKTLGLMNCSNTRYQIEISVKDGKYKFDVTRLEQYQAPSQYAVGGWSEVSLANTSYCYKENGELKSLFKLYPSAIETEFNSLNKDLETFAKSETVLSKKSDW